MTRDEWNDIITELHTLWPDRIRWDAETIRRSYERLRRFDASTVWSAVFRLRGPHPPSPAALEAKVAEVAAEEARWAQPSRPALPGRPVTMGPLAWAEVAWGEPVTWEEHLARWADPNRRGEAEARLRAYSGGTGDPPPAACPGHRWAHFARGSAPAVLEGGPFVRCLTCGVEKITGQHDPGVVV